MKWNGDMKIMSTAAVDEASKTVLWHGGYEGKRMSIAGVKESNQGRVIVHTPEPRDGAAKYVSELVVALREAREDVILFCPENFEYRDAVLAAGVEISNAPSRDVSQAGLVRRVVRNLTFMFKAARAQYKLVHRGDVVHFQNTLHLPLGFVFYWLVSMKGGRIVLTAHDPLPHRWRFPQSMRWIEKGMLKIAYSLCDAIVVHNENGKEILLKEFQQNSERIAVIPHGPDTHAQHNSEFPEFDCLRLLAFGSIRENKGIHLAIEAVQRLCKGGGIPVRLTIAGKLYTAAEQGYWRRCEELIAAAPEPMELLVRFITDDEISPLLARHHAVILPYLDFFSESGVAALSLSHQRPMIATPTGGLREILDMSPCGIAIKQPTVEGVEEAISKALSLGRGQLKEMGIAGDKFLQSTRSWGTIAMRTCDLYDGLPAAPGRAVPVSH